MDKEVERLLLETTGLQERLANSENARTECSYKIQELQIALEARNGFAEKLQQRLNELEVC